MKDSMKVWNLLKQARRKERALERGPDRGLPGKYRFKGFFTYLLLGVAQSL
jgi:hypothetical protein